ncbi:hypothetical protein [Vibrio tapetis]|uniref:Uncharacterized protein n=1 Tax=Vibrio tapetis subsp. tapetis TaxID=1671868 RepID=A0A2N8Z9G8_9VIBR|nr:hypothetical protein [Vibrio tapetis]SON48561.1 conserved protein of unknown function [Vibrio tapetis subsp. tapetis]
MCLDNNFFDQRDQWLAQQAQNGSVRLFDFCLDFGFKYENLIFAGILERIQHRESKSLVDFKLTEKGSDFVDCEFETFMVKGPQLNELAAYVEEFFLNQFLRTA